jgi:hypothetical protein
MEKRWERITIVQQTALLFILLEMNETSSGYVTEDMSSKGIILFGKSVGKDAIWETQACEGR